MSPNFSDSDKDLNTSYISKSPKKKARLPDSLLKHSKMAPQQKHNKLPSQQNHSKPPTKPKQSQPLSKQKQSNPPSQPGQSQTPSQNKLSHPLSKQKQNQSKSHQKLRNTPLPTPGSKPTSVAPKVAANVQAKISVLDKTQSKQELDPSLEIAGPSSKISAYKYQDPISSKSRQDSSDEFSELDFSNKTKVSKTKKLSPEPYSQSSGQSISFD